MMEITPLGQSLRQLAQRRIASDADYLSARGMSAPANVDEGLLSDYRQFNLTRTLAYARENSRHYAASFAGIDLESVQVGDLSSLPFTTARDLSDDPFSFLCLSQTNAARAITFESSGTTGPSKRLFFTAADMERATDFMACGIATVAKPGDAVQILLPGGPSGGQADLLRVGVEKMGARAVITGLDLPFDDQIEAIREHDVKVLFGETHLIYRLTKSCEGAVDLRSLGIRCVFVTTSHCSAAMRAYLEQTWGARVSVHYGMTEMGLGVAVSCPHCGVLHYNELDVVFEVVDAVNGDPVPVGCMGEVVATSLNREAMPIIRFKTGDVARMRPASPSCPSWPLFGIEEVEYRKETRVRLLDGTPIHPVFFHDALFSIDSVVDYELALESAGRGDRIVFHVESQDCGESVSRIITGNAVDALQVAGAVDMPEIAVVFEPHEKLRQGRHFKKLIQDNRRWRPGSV